MILGFSCIIELNFFLKNPYLSDLLYFVLHGILLTIWGGRRQLFNMDKGGRVKARKCGNKEGQIKKVVLQIIKQFFFYTGKV